METPHSDPCSRRVLLLSPEYGPEISGGVGTYTQELSASLGGTRYDMHVVACSYKKGNTTCSPDGKIHLVVPSSSGNGHSIVEGILAFNKDLRNYVRTAYKENPPDLIQCENWVTFPAGHDLADHFQVPLVANIQYLSYPLERWWGQSPDPAIEYWERRLVDSVDQIVTVSESMKTVLTEELGVPGRKICVVYNGINADSFTPPLTGEQKMRLRSKIAADGERVIVFTGRLNAQKGVLPLLLACAALLKEGIHLKLVLAGDADSRTTRDQIRSIFGKDDELRRAVVLLGKIPRNQVGILYRVADVAVVPSIYEPFGFVALEAMAVGTPVVACRAGGLAEIIRHEESGLLVPVDSGAKPHAVDVNALAMAIRRIITSPDMAKAWGENAYARVRQYFSIERCAAGMIRVYDALRPGL